jgi:hypothetical protein
MANCNIEQPAQVVVLAMPTSEAPLPLIEAHLLNDIICDAIAADCDVPIRPNWWKRHPKIAWCGMMLAIALIAAAVAVPMWLNSKPIPNPIPKNVSCFSNRTELVTAIDLYAEQDCPNDKGCKVGQMYVGR